MIEWNNPIKWILTDKFAVLNLFIIAISSTDDIERFDISVILYAKTDNSIDT